MTLNKLQQNLQKLSGSIERITFHNEDSGFCVLKAKVRGQLDLVTVIGSAATVAPGEYIECQGLWVNDKQHGMQFKAEHLKVIPPTTIEGIEKYLSSGLIKGIGPHFAKVLIKAFGETVFDVIDNHPNRLTKLPGIGKKRKKMILTAWAEQKVIRTIMVFLQSHGVGTARAVRIYKTYGDHAIEIVRENPYRLAIDIFGIGFKTADALAMRLGIAKDSIKRAEAGVIHVLQEFAAEGHCALLREKICQATAELLEIEKEIIESAIDAEIKEKRLVLETINDNACLFLASLYMAELSSAKNIARLKKGQPPWGNINYEKALHWAAEKTHITLSPSQRQAVLLALKEKVTIITGGPGVGKTTIINNILKIVRAKKIQVALAAPTGRAAKRLNEATGCTAKTIHRLLEFDPSTHAFRHNQNNPLRVDMVIVDEASMIDIVLWHNFTKAIPDHAALLIVGDIDQLPSVGPGAVLADLIISNTIPVASLTEIFRQAAKSQIIVNAHRVNQGQFPATLHTTNDGLTDFYFIEAETPEIIHEKLLQVVTERIPNRFGFNAKNDIQILTPMNRGGLGSRSLNSILQEKLNPHGNPRITRFGTTYAPGDKIIQNVNNYDKDVFNGDIGIITSIDVAETSVRVNYDGHLVVYDFNELDEVQLAYATSIHKSQGSEYPVVVIPIATQHFMLLARNLLYTAITRGKKLVVIIGQVKALAIAIRNVATKKRLTNLPARLKELL
ncbi:MAG: ATP-dependent RecD-like DNA helicase [Gammaproteobacteria bacterium]|nr:ATP-dependent RecD-like DNA helicase [Gammaproteobacteria bacterium]